MALPEVDRIKMEGFKAKIRIINSGDVDFPYLVQKKTWTGWMTVSKRATLEMAEFDFSILNTKGKVIKEA